MTHELSNIILVSLWDFQDSKCSIIHKYDADEANKLQKQGHFPENIKLDADTNFAEYGEEHMVAFDYGDPSDSEDDEEDKESSSEEEINLDDI